MKKQKHPKYLEKGMKFGRLTVIEVDESSKIKDGKETIPSRWKYSCICSCSEQNIISVAKSDLLTRHTKSCGCIRKERTKETAFNNRKTNSIEVDGDITKIFFFNAPGEYTIVDTENYDKIKDFCWRKEVDSKGKVYASAHPRGKYDKGIIKVHQIICPCEKGFEPDHIDGDGLNNRKSNLRPLTHQENMWNQGIRKSNTSGVVGVSWCQRDKLWAVSLKVKNNNKGLGYHKDKNKLYELGL